MLLHDEGRVIGETTVRAALAADTEGAHLSEAVAALLQLGSAFAYVYCAKLDTPGLREAVSRGPAMVFLKGDPQDGFGHIVIVDEFGSDDVCIRDPWPLASGAAYAVGLNDFEKAWLVHTTDAGKAGQAVVLE